MNFSNYKLCLLVQRDMCVRRASKRQFVFTRQWQTQTRESNFDMAFETRQRATIKSLGVFFMFFFLPFLNRLLKSLFSHLYAQLTFFAFLPHLLYLHGDQRRRHYFAYSSAIPWLKKKRKKKRACMAIASEFILIAFAIFLRRWFLLVFFSLISACDACALI